MNKKEKENYVKSNYIAVVFFFVIVTLISIWCIDVSVSAMINGGIDAYMTNGFFNVNPLMSYHFGLYGIILSMAGFVMVFSHWVIMGKNAKNK